MCLGLAERGARVVVASRKLAACEDLVAEIAAQGGEAFAVACHVGDWPSLEGVVDAAASRWDRLDGLINNAGMSPIAPSLLETSEALFDKVVAVNLKGPTRLSALAAQAMKDTRGAAHVNETYERSHPPRPQPP